MKFCPNCNSQLADDAKFCTGCGLHLNTEPAMQSVQPEVPTMDSVVPPVITDDMFAQAPQEQQSAQQYAQPQAQPAQQFAQQQFAQPQGFVQQQGFAQPQGFAQQQQGFAQPQGFAQQNSFRQSFAQQPVEAGYTQPGQEMMQDTPEYVNPAAPQMPGVVPGKKGGSLIVPIILIILIIAVILVDVFWLFREQIWGKGDSSSTAAASYITMTDE